MGYKIHYVKIIKQEAILCFFLIFLLLQGLSPQNETLLTNNTMISDKAHIVTIASDKTFDDLIANNPIDMSLDLYDKEISIERIHDARVYQDAWLAEADYTLSILKNYLSEDDFCCLTDAHNSWMQYLENTTRLEQSLYYPGSEYLTGGSYTYPLVMEMATERSRTYAIDLMSYEYALTGDVLFLYEAEAE